jgi:hypothetical protein
MSTLKLVGVTVLVIILFQIFFILYSSSNLPSETQKAPENKTPKLRVEKKFRKIQTIHKSVDSYEGGGFLVHRSIGSTNLRNLDPFLMLE